MATVYFSSPIMHKNTKLEAVAGKRTTLLGFAKEHKIPIPTNVKTAAAARV